ncbi:8-oxo-dGTP diphosphatase [Paenibacillus cellulosilyticus]|uniref:8-oxo-dGTP diphosphatase n=1 Tax=Paenibacillus cellulosilyticus TaxID=375489 RepID=A0A2V2YVW1_9BACL|nr:NUDIX domain-containing protein [Paenibacillus cellulosilyticus]PWW04764.1 8-oxo-dGTP diphosphatase [Paenibacillus cellulosilyticus]QKS45887.1 NUDIX domain-containing protein [Paenibacillus cellulosilyticus]
MSIVTDAKGNVLLDLITITESDLHTIELDAPLTHALIVVKCQGKFLMMFNKWRSSWELPGGVIEPGESARECVVRELLEETNQNASEIAFKGLMKFHLQPSFHGPERMEFGALYYAELSELDPFIENEEAARIILWDAVSDIGTVAIIDHKLLELV